MARGLDIGGRPGGERSIRVGFIGCGTHAFRNIYPTFQFLPIDLVAVCDRDTERADAFAKLFGGDTVYTDHAEMLAKETDLDAVFVVTSYDEQWKPQFPKLAIDVMRSGRHAWIEKPPAASVAEIDQMIEVEKETGRFTMVGLKKCFFPANEKVKEIISSEAFGTPGQFIVRYPQYIPAADEKPNLRGNHRLVSFLDHLVHPASILQFLAGPVKTLYFVRDASGGGFANLIFRSGATGVIHFSCGQSGTSPLERLEVVGEGANVIVENGIKLTYYRPGSRGPGGYGRSPNFIGPDTDAPITWEPEFSLGQLYNKGLFLLGYFSEVAAFAEAVCENKRPDRCNLDDAREIMKLYEAFMGPEGTVIELPE